MVNCSDSLQEIASKSDVYQTSLPTSSACPLCGSSKAFEYKSVWVCGTYMETQLSLIPGEQCSRVRLLDNYQQELEMYETVFDSPSQAQTIKKTLEELGMKLNEQTISIKGRKIIIYCSSKKDPDIHQIKWLLNKAKDYASEEIRKYINDKNRQLF